MIDNYREAIALMDKMKTVLPIPAYPSKEFVSLLKQKSIKLKTDRRLEIIDVHYSGDEDGIIYTLKFPFKTEENYIVSLTHLRPMSNHPLSKEIRKYQIHRIRRLAQQ